jgi:hypothetical protein
MAGGIGFALSDFSSKSPLSNRNKLTRLPMKANYYE